MKTQKNLMSKIALLSLLFFFVGMTTTFAQKRGGQNDDNGTPTEKAEKKSQKWKTKFNLNDTQTAQLKTALITRITAMDAAKGGEKSPEKREQRKAVMTQFDTQVKSILDATQYAAYQKMKEEKKAKRKGKRGQNSDEEF